MYAARGRVGEGSDAAVRRIGRLEVERDERKSSSGSSVIARVYRERRL